VLLREKERQKKKEMHAEIVKGSSQAFERRVKFGQRGKKREGK
jgi:hypothetical protein